MKSVLLQSANFFAKERSTFDDEIDDEIAYFTVRRKTRELVLSTAPKHEITPTKTVKTENGPISQGNQSEMSMVRDGGNDLPKR